MTTTQTPAPDPRPTLLRAVDQAVTVIGLAGPADLDRPTPCTEFDVRHLLGHLVAVLGRVTYVAGGGHAFDVPSMVLDVPDDAWAMTAKERAGELRAAWSDDAVLDRVLQLPFGNVPGRGAALAYTQELTTHAWDLASALGHREVLDDELGQVAADAARRFVPDAGRGETIPTAATQPTTRPTTSPAAVVRIPTRGPFALEELGRFGYGHLTLQPWDGVWRLAFGLDDRSGHAGVEVRQVAAQELELVVHAAPASVDVAVRQATRIASCDHDGDAFHNLGDTDPVLQRLIASAPGLRPPLFVSPYEAAVWALLTQRRSRRQGTGLRQWISDRHGVAFDLAGRRVSALPLPERLLEVEAVPGLPAEQVPRLHAVARAALDGLLDVDRLAALDPELARRELETIPGIGPFSSALVVTRACGLSDVLPLAEPRSRAAVTGLYAAAGVIDGELSDDAYRELAQRWRPFRTWVAVMARAAGGRVAPEPAGSRSA